MMQSNKYIFHSKNIKYKKNNLIVIIKNKKNNFMLYLVIQEENVIFHNMV